MKTSVASQSFLSLAGLALAVAALHPILFADEPAAAAAQSGAKAADKTAEKLKDFKNDHSELSKTEVKAALAQLDAELDHLDQLAEAAPSPDQKAEVKLRYDLLKQRRTELKKEFTRARYEEFKADLQAEVDRVSAWARETFQKKPAASSADKTASATADATSTKIAGYKTESTAANKAEVKASLAQLDADIEILSVRIDAIADADRKAQLNRRLDAYKERRSELNSEFRQARYDALVADVKAEWNQFTP